VNKIGADGSNPAVAQLYGSLLWVVGSCSLPFVQSVNSIYVKTSLKSQLLAVVILSTRSWLSPIARGREPSAQFHKGLRTVDQIELREMILPSVCIDVHDPWVDYLAVESEVIDGTCAFRSPLRNGEVEIWQSEPPATAK
jgi:hypothetical protein